MALAVGVGAWVLHALPSRDPDTDIARWAGDLAPIAPVKAASSPYGAISDPGFFSESNLASLTSEFSLQADLDAEPPVPAETVAQLEDVPLPPKRDVAEIEDSAPLPPPRPVEFGSPATTSAPDLRSPQQPGRTAAPPAAVDNRSFIQKLFGLAQPPAPSVPYAAPESRAAPSVAYAAPESRAAPNVAYAAPESRAAGRAPFAVSVPSGRTLGNPFGSLSPAAAGYDQYTAVYDISARTVYLPDGTRLEAHSGLGDRLDDPRYVSERGRGPTPPHVYELTAREESFHGVQALRLNPVGDGDLFGRAGLLAHPYMLGPNGDSNGCVSFKDYEAFLRAYQNGQVKRLVVVARL